MGLGRLAFVAFAGSLATALLVEDTQHVNRTAVDQGPDPGAAVSVIGGLFAQLLTKLVNCVASPAPSPGSVKVLVFGDWWTNVGMGPGLLETLFDQRNVPLHIRHVRGHKMGACNQAETPSTLADAIASEFGAEAPDYVWYTAGGYDLIHPGERAFKSDKCPHAQRETTEADAVACLKAFTTEDTNKCTDQLLMKMWENPLYADVKVVQLGYDLPCMEGSCKKSQPQAEHDPYCKGQDTCHRSQLMHWNEFALGKEFHEFGAHADKYTGINILGAMQSAHPVTSGLAVEPGKPNLEKGSPCKDTTFCLWPKKGTPGYRAIANAFWDKYWALEKLDVLVTSRAAATGAGGTIGGPGGVLPKNADPFGPGKIGGNGGMPKNADPLGPGKIGGNGGMPKNADPLGPGKIGGNGGMPKNADPVGPDVIGGKGGVLPKNADPLGPDVIGGNGGVLPKNADPVGPGVIGGNGGVVPATPGTSKGFLKNIPTPVETQK